MAHYGKFDSFTVQAAADLSTLQWYAITLAGVRATNGRDAAGLIINKPKSGEFATVGYQGSLNKNENAQQGVDRTLEAHTLSADADLGMSVLLRTGARLATDFSIDFFRFVLGGDPRTVANARVGATLSQPLLRGAGREMSRKQLGMTCVVDDLGRLAGIITDGDLRRHMDQPDLLEQPAATVMTATPLTISRSLLAVQALALMEQRKITSLVVIDDQRKIDGVLHLHDLWRTQMF